MNEDRCSDQCVGGHRQIEVRFVSHACRKNVESYIRNGRARTRGWQSGRFVVFSWGEVIKLKALPSQGNANSPDQLNKLT